MSSGRTGGSTPTKGYRPGAGRTRLRPYNGCDRPPSHGFRRPSLRRARLITIMAAGVLLVALAVAYGTRPSARPAARGRAVRASYGIEARAGSFCTTF